MREMKYRAWDKEEKKMLYDGFAICANGAAQRIEWNEIFEEKLKDLDPTASWGLLDFSDWYCSEYFELMQFTGLYDNGRDVYEGDIYQWCGLRYPITIDVLHGYRFMFGKDQLCKAFIDEGELLGNIYENPDLLQ